MYIWTNTLVTQQSALLRLPAQGRPRAANERSRTRTGQIAWLQLRDLTSPRREELIGMNLEIF